MVKFNSHCKSSENSLIMCMYFLFFSGSSFFAFLLLGRFSQTSICETWSQEGGGLCFCPFRACEPGDKPTQGAALGYGQAALSGRVTIGRKGQRRCNLFFFHHHLVALVAFFFSFFLHNVGLFLYFCSTFYCLFYRFFATSYVITNVNMNYNNIDFVTFCKVIACVVLT